MDALNVPGFASQPTPPLSSPPLITRLEYDGEFHRIFRIWLGNLLLFFITLSFYRFWGRTRLRQYVWSHTSIFGDRLEYSGTGKELCMGFLLTIPIFFLLGVVSELFNSGAFTWLPILFIGYFAVYSGLRYRLTRTSWRAIRGYMPTDGFNGYTTLCFKRAGMNVITFGIAVPKSDLLKWQFLVEQLQFGNIRAKFNFDTKGLMLPHLITSVVGIVIISIVIAISTGVAEKLLEKRGDEKIAEMMAGIITLAVVMALPILFLVRQWYTAILVRKKFSGIEIGNVSIRYQCGVGRFIGFKFVNLMILILTLGLGGAFILHRKAKFFARHLHFAGTLDETMVKQMQMHEPQRFAEGFLDTFGFDFGILS